MTTSRTGTASHKRWRTQILRRDQHAGITHCPDCGTALDYEHSRQPNSAEPDHITPWARGGRNTLDNGRTICRQCNQSRGSRTRAKRHTNTTFNVTIVTNLVQW